METQEVMLNGKKIELVMKLSDEEMEDEILINNDDDDDKTVDLTNEINKIRETNENE